MRREENWGGFGPEPDLEDQFAGLKLHGEEEDDLDLSGEVEELVKDVRWRGLFRFIPLNPLAMPLC